MKTAVRTAYRNLDALTIIVHILAAGTMILAIAKGEWPASITTLSILLLFMTARYQAVCRLDARAAQADAEDQADMLDHMRMSDREAYLSAAHQLAEEIDLNAALTGTIRELRDKIAATKETTA